MHELNRLKPMSIWMASLYFLIPAALGIAGFYILMPFLIRSGFSELWAYFMIQVGVFILLLAFSLIGFKSEGHPFTWKEIKGRFRIKPIQGKEWYWLAGLIAFYVGGQLLLASTRPMLASLFPRAIPSSLLGVLDPRETMTEIPSEFMGFSLAGQWWIVGLVLVLWVLNVLGEEFWWRGYILPRQELAHGKWAWLIHGVLWTLFHAAFWWNFIALLPSTFSLSFVVSKLRNSTHGIVVHGLLNGLAVIALILGVLGG